MSSTVNLDEWVPRTRLGRMVLEGEITSIDEIFRLGRPIREWQIVDFLLPNLKDEVVDINVVQKVSDAGRKRRFKATVVVGNEDGYVGVGESKSREIGPAIRNAILDAKINITAVKRGCGSWECGCGGPHSVPFRVEGKQGSVVITLYPAPKGLGLVAGDIAKTVLRLAGIKDVWSKTLGDTRTTHNFAKATYNALKQTYQLAHPDDWTRA